MSNIFWRFWIITQTQDKRPDRCFQIIRVDGTEEDRIWQSVHYRRIIGPLYWQTNVPARLEAR